MPARATTYAGPHGRLSEALKVLLGTIQSARHTLRREHEGGKWIACAAAPQVARAARAVEFDDGASKVRSCRTARGCAAVSVRAVIVASAYWTDVNKYLNSTNADSNEYLTC